MSDVFDPYAVLDPLRMERQINELSAGGGSGVSVTDAGNGNVVVTPSPGTGTFTLDVNPTQMHIGAVLITSSAGGVGLAAPSGVAGIAGEIAEVVGPSSQALQINSTGIILVGLPSSDPHVLNALWVESGGALMVSAG